MDLVTQQKLERRELIMEAARALLAEHGYSRLTMRDLAAHCRVSVPTLYNQFGSKDSLLAASAETHFAGLLADSRERSWSGHRRLVGVLGVCADEMARLPRYHRALLRALVGVRNTTELQATLAGELAAELERALQEMRARDQLEGWVQAPVLAQQITRASVAASISWSLGELDDSQLRASMVHAATSMTLGVACGSARAALEREARRTQQILATSRPRKHRPSS